MNLQDRLIIEPPKNAGKIILAYSSAGVGKTSTFCQAPKALLIECKDQSSESLKESGSIRADLPVVKAEGWDDALSILDSLVEGGHDFKNIVIDGGSGLHEWSDKLVTDVDFEGSREKFLSFGKGDRGAGFYWQELMQRLNDLKNAGLWVFILCHKATATERNPSGSDYLKSVPHLSKDKLAQTLKFSDAILFMDFVTTQVDVNKQSKVGKAVGGEQRVMYTRPSASYEAKNRMNLADPIMLGDSPKEAFAAFAAAVRAGRAKDQKEKVNA